jgi:hypothetical protein
MKRCPTCNRTFTDPNLSFCIEDGTPLIKAVEPAYDSEATIVSTSSSSGGPDNETQSSDQDGSGNGWSSPAYQPPPKFPPPPPSQRRKVWPWVVGSIGLLVIVFVGLGIAAAVFIPQMMKESVRNNRNSGNSTNTRSTENQNSGANANDNSNSTGLNQNESVNENSSDTEPPTNEEIVLADLKNIEDEWTVANLNADKKKLAKILADDYVSMVNGKMQGKADYLRDIKPDPNIQRWEFHDLKLKLNGSRATLEGVVNLQSSEQSEPQSLRFTDKFVWRDSRWQAVSSEVAPETGTKN